MAQMKEVTFGICPYPFDFEQISELTSLAEDLGYYSCMFPDHLIWYKGEPALRSWPVITALALKTEKIKVGTAVCVPQLMHPAVLAATIATIDYISKGRLLFGIGSGSALNTVPYGISFDKPALKLRETVDIIKRLLTGETIDYDGRFYKLKQACVPVANLIVQRPLPIWMAAAGPIAMRVAAEMADCWIGIRLSPELYREDLEKIRDLAKKFGRRETDVDGCYCFRTALAKRMEDARALMEETRKTYVVSKRERERLGTKTPSETEGVWEGYKGQMASWEDIEMTCPFGTPDKVINSLEKYVEAGCRHFIFIPVGTFKDMMKTVKLYAEEVFPSFTD